ncbi:DUF4097 domain-containing protein [Streptomyces sp. N2-109]|uniref:DUF4097 domain-containing protein n=1 Tax=Streptomyces gossypii TaxID=2883101 RepID=A0ABT2JXY9_9ACTN|nr:DUF4097 domain-containing protein [Streptomyces gossypii]MCT2592746.1 DUF4097 domain-containing protein [Streptomyces gossypii]
MTGNRPRRTAAACALLVAVATLATSCSLIPDEGKTSKSAYSLDVDDTKALTVDTKGGDIEVVAADSRSDAIRVIERYEWDEQKPRTEHGQQNGRLTLQSDDCGDAERTCDVDYEVRVPAGTSLHLKSGGGDMKVSGMSGTVKAATQGGDIHVDDSSSRRVTAHSEGGDLLGAFTDSPSRVSFTSAGGDIDVRLPTGSYAVDATTAGGDRNVTVPSKDTSDRHIKAHTDGGDVAVRNPA